MYADTIVKENGLRYVNSDGAIVTQKGWRLLSNGYIYIQDNGTVCTGIKMINGVIYYFGEDGIWIADMNKNLSQVLQEIEINVILKKAFKDKNGLKCKK